MGRPPRGVLPVLRAPLRRVPPWCDYNVHHAAAAWPPPMPPSSWVSSSYAAHLHDYAHPDEIATARFEVELY